MHSFFKGHYKGEVPPTHADKDTTFVRNVGMCQPRNTVQYPKRPESPNYILPTTDVVSEATFNQPIQPCQTCASFAHVVQLAHSCATCTTSPLSPQILTSSDMHRTYRAAEARTNDSPRRRSRNWPYTKQVLAKLGLLFVLPTALNAVTSRSCMKWQLAGRLPLECWNRPGI